MHTVPDPSSSGPEAPLGAAGGHARSHPFRDACRPDLWEKHLRDTVPAPPARPPRSQPFLPRSQHAFCVLAEPPSPCSYGPGPSASGTRAERGAGLAPGLLDPLVECVGMLGELLAQLVILLLPALLLLQLQLPFLRTEGRQRPRQPPSRPLLHRQAQDGDSALGNEAAGLTI